MLRCVLVLLFPTFILMHPMENIVIAQESVSLKVAEKNVGDALALALKLAARRKIKFAGKGLRGILNEEVAPHSGQYVSSYKVLGGSGRGWVNLEASVDVTALRAIFALSQANFKSKAPKAVIMIKGHNGNSTWRGSAYDELEQELVTLLEASVRARFERRGISFIPRINEYLDFVSDIDESSGPSLRSIAQKVDADLVVYLEPEFRTGDKPGAGGMRFFLKGLIYDKQRDEILGASEQSVPMWMGERSLKSKNEKITEAVNDHIDSTVHEVFMLSGSRLLANVSSVSYLTIRLVQPPDFPAIDQIRAAMGKMKGVRYVVERKVTPGYFDFWVDSEFGKDRLRKEFRRLDLDGYSVSIIKNQETVSSDDVSISIRMEKKASASEGSLPSKERSAKGA